MTNGAPIRQWRRPIQNPILRMILRESRETGNCARLQSADLDNVDCGLSLSS